MALIELKGVSKIYKSGEHELSAEGACLKMAHRCFGVRV